MAVIRRAGDSPLTLITPSDAEAIATQVLSQVAGKTSVHIYHIVNAWARFARNDVQTFENEATLSVNLNLNIDGKVARGSTTRTDADGLRDLVRTTEEAARATQKDSNEAGVTLASPATFTDPPIYFESSVKAGASDVQGELVRHATAQVDAAGLIAGGSTGAIGFAELLMNSAGFRGYTRKTYGEFNMTARTEDGHGSGWAWGGHEDFSRLDPAAIVDKAINLCRRSDKPVAIEPGRYTVILEPEALAQLMEPVTNDVTFMMDASAADAGASVYSKKEGGNKLGLKMADERVQISYDPWDPDLPFSPLAWDGSFYAPTHWFENGILRNLSWSADYAKQHNRKKLGNPGGKAKLDIAGPKQTLEEMIASTKRGIWVHHFDSGTPVNGRTLLLTGVTRDGTFLIENGKVSRSIKNLRFNESPFFILNKIDASGPTGRASPSWAVPRLKVHDFEFTSLSDAI